MSSRVTRPFLALGSSSGSSFTTRFSPSLAYSSPSSSVSVSAAAKACNSSQAETWAGRIDYGFDGGLACKDRSNFNRVACFRLSAPGSVSRAWSNSFSSSGMTYTSCVHFGPSSWKPSPKPLSVEAVVTASACTVGFWEDVKTTNMSKL